MTEATIRRSRKKGMSEVAITFPAKSKREAPKKLYDIFAKLKPKSKRQKEALQFLIDQVETAPMTRVKRRKKKRAAA